MSLGGWLGRVLLGGRSAGQGFAAGRPRRLGELGHERLQELILGCHGATGEGRHADADDGSQGDGSNQRQPSDLAQAAPGESATRAGRDPGLGGGGPRGGRGPGRST